MNACSHLDTPSTEITAHQNSSRPNCFCPSTFRASMCWVPWVLCGICNGNALLHVKAVTLVPPRHHHLPRMCIVQSGRVARPPFFLG